MRTSPRDTHEAGFTLLEMIVVLVIIGLAVALVGPRTGNVTPQVQLRASVQRLSAELRIARSEALRTSMAQTVTIDPVKRAFWMGERGKPTALPSSVVISAAQASLATESGGASTVTGPLRIVFSPDGSSSGAAIGLSVGALAANVTVDWLTGATRVAWQRGDRS